MATRDEATGEVPAGAVVELADPDGAGAVVLVCEHASRVIPPELGDLGLDAAALASHIAWDPGALAVARAMARRLDAPLVAQRVSRLVYDCNRAPGAESAIPARSELHDIPGNAGLTEAQRAARAERFYRPFRDALAGLLDRRLAAGKPTALVTVHSFTPVYAGVRRDLDVGILHDRDTRLADALLAVAAAEKAFVVRRNQPYGPQDGVTHTLLEHGIARGLANVMIEIRNDLIADAAGQEAMAARLTRWLDAALAALSDPATAAAPHAGP